MHPGQEVVCIDVKGLPHLLTEGKVYTIKATRADLCTCGNQNTYLVDVGIPTHHKGIRCNVCGKIEMLNDGIAWVLNTHFVSIDGISIAEAYEVLEKKPFSL